MTVAPNKHMQLRKNCLVSDWLYRSYGSTLNQHEKKKHYRNIADTLNKYLDFIERDTSVLLFKYRSHFYSSQKEKHERTENLENNNFFYLLVLESISKRSRALTEEPAEEFKLAKDNVNENVMSCELFRSNYS